MKKLISILFSLSLLSQAQEKKTTAKVIANLVTAITDYYEEYQQLPLGSLSNADASHSTSGKKGKPLMAALLGLESSEEENYKLRSFFATKAAEEKKGGLLRTKNTAELFDPWGNPYHILFNYDYDDELKDPFSGKIVKDQKVLIWSNGPDGKPGTPDDIRSWWRK